MATYTIYGSQGTMLPPNPTLMQEAAQDVEINNFWINVPSPLSSHGITISQVDLQKLFHKNTLEIVVRKMQNRANITFDVNYKNTEFPLNPPQVNIAQRIQGEGNKAIFKFRINTHTISQISQFFTKDLRVTFGVNNGVISLWILQMNSPLVPVLANSPQPLGIGLTNPSGGVKIPR